MPANTIGLHHCSSRSILAPRAKASAISRLIASSGATPVMIHLHSPFVKKKIARNEYRHFEMIDFAPPAWYTAALRLFASPHFSAAYRRVSHQRSHAPRLHTSTIVAAFAAADITAGRNFIIASHRRTDELASPRGQRQRIRYR